MTIDTTIEDNINSSCEWVSCRVSFRSDDWERENLTTSVSAQAAGKFGILPVLTSIENNYSIPFHIQFLGGGAYIDGINGIFETEKSGWKYIVNDNEPKISGDEYRPSEGDNIIFVFESSDSMSGGPRDISY